METIANAAMSHGCVRGTADNRDARQRQAEQVQCRHGLMTSTVWRRDNCARMTTRMPAQPAAATPARHLYEDLAEDLAALVATRNAPRPGDRLPSVRMLSQQRGVSVSTVLQAYVLLETPGRGRDAAAVRPLREGAAPRARARAAHAARGDAGDARLGE